MNHRISPVFKFLQPIELRAAEIHIQKALKLNGKFASFEVLGVNFEVGRRLPGPKTAATPTATFGNLGRINTELAAGARTAYRMDPDALGWLVYAATKLWQPC